MKVISQKQILKIYPNLWQVNLNNGSADNLKICI